MKGLIAVFCSASYDISPEYNKVARDFVRAASLCGYGIVSGGTVKGTMGEIAEEIVQCGGYHRGVIPYFMKDLVYPQMSETIWTDTMSERKSLLREGTGAVVALPGGIGTLDEVVEVCALKHLKKYDGEVFLLNHKGFYEPLRDLFRHYLHEKMLSKETFEKIRFVDSSEELLDILENNGY